MASAGPGNGIQAQGVSYAGVPGDALQKVGQFVQGIMNHQHQQTVGKATPSKGEVIHYAAQQYGVPVALMLAVAKNESGFRNSATSPVGAQGMFQLMPGTAKGLGVDPANPVENIMGGAMYLSQLLKQFHSIPAAIAAYNAGPGAVQKYRGIPPFAETRAYVNNVMAAYQKLLKTYPLQATSRENGNF